MGFLFGTSHRRFFLILGIARSCCLTINGIHAFAFQSTVNLIAARAKASPRRQRSDDRHTAHYRSYDRTTSLHLVGRDEGEEERTLLADQLWKFYAPNGSSTATTGNGNGNPEEPKKKEGRLLFLGHDVETMLVVLVPLLAPMVAYCTYEYVAQGFSSFQDMMSGNNWYSVDGGALEAKVIAPAINGVLVPATSLLYATLASTTISTLRQRQLDMRKAINLEAGELRHLALLVQAYPRGSSVRDHCKRFLMKYATRIVSECAPNVSTGEDVIDPRKGMETELNAFLVQVHRSYSDPIPPHLCDQSLAAIGRLREYRLTRVTALQSTYPVVHYMTLILLAVTGCLVFLIETNQDLLFFLSAFQLKVLWSMLVGTYSACATVVYDLQSPFQGSYQIGTSVDQIQRIQNSMAAASFDRPIRSVDLDEETI